MKYLSVEDFDFSQLQADVKVALVSPSQNRIRRNSNINPSIMPPIGLMEIHTAIKSIGGYSVKIFDEETSSSRESFLSTLANFLGSKGILAIQTYTRTFDEVEKILDFFDSMSYLKILGGHYVTASPNITKSHINIRGKGSQPMVQLLRLIQDETAPSIHQLSRISGSYFSSKNGTIKDNGIHAYSLHQIDYFDSDIEYYRYTPSSAYEHPEATKVFFYISSFGCRKRCSFCSSSIINKKTYFIPLNAVLEILEIAISKGFNYVQFWDDNLLQRPYSDLVTIFTFLKNRRVIYSCFTRADSITEKHAHLLSTTDCYRVFIGLESGNNEILKYYKKGTFVSDYIRAFELLNMYNIKVLCGFILGSSIETEKSIADSIELAIQINPLAIWFQHLSIDPGTTLFKKYVKLGVINAMHVNIELYGEGEPRGLPVVSNFSQQPKHDKLFDHKLEKQVFNRLFNQLFQKFYERQQHHDRYFIHGNQSEQKYLSAIYELANIQMDSFSEK